MSGIGSPLCVHPALAGLAWSLSSSLQALKFNQSSFRGTSHKKAEARVG